MKCEDAIKFHMQIQASPGVCLFTVMSHKTYPNSQTSKVNCGPFLSLPLGHNQPHVSDNNINTNNNNINKNIYYNNDNNNIDTNTAATTTTRTNNKNNDNNNTLIHA